MKLCSKGALALLGASLLGACGGPSVDAPDADFLRPDGGMFTPPCVPSLEMTPAQVPYPLVTIRGNACEAKRILVRGGENPLVTRVLPDESFCIDVPLREPRDFNLQVLGQNGAGELSTPQNVAVTFNPSAPDIPGARTCSGASPRGCMTSTETCDNGRDDDCDSLIDAADPDCATCDDDLLEQNDDIPAPQIEPGRYDDLRICPGNRDYFAFALEGTDEIRARALFAHSAGDLDISLLDPNGMAVATSMTVDDDESLMYVVPPTQGGVYHVFVTGVDDEVRNDYTLDVSVR